ncbi:rhombosortase [Rivibacter subsaxonicus]|uniref:Rhomboid family GlyGly-CTERM serine protease n=1 Tax=Rivibacter subsaxonicus TaxID=457575 RepID=A0A4Q7VVG3_9BURK|nr:rhombosortase [Rivibacter subsaxonicus]RZU00641.1 rhomboid family GlyGly-CTERM serine protease [Rivibacter subsaxonicus]
MNDATARQRAVGAWFAAGALLLLPAVLLAITGPPSELAHGLEWRPTRTWIQPWRIWSAAWVHYSQLHLLANMAGAVLVIALGIAARMPTRAALAWFMAWPLTHLALLLRPELAGYGGLSGVLHAGVAVVAVELILRSGRERRLGLAIAAVLLLKIVLEEPWGPALRWPAGWDIAVAPFSHAAGVVAGALCALLAARLFRDQPRMRRTSEVVE